MIAGRFPLSTFLGEMADTKWERLIRCALLFSSS